jgi:hypothetical protein
MGDAGEALVVAELTLAGVPAAKMPDNWPGYDVIAETKGAEHPQRISVKSRTLKPGADVYYHVKDDRFDWLAIVVLDCPVQPERQIFIIPKTIADARFHRGGEKTKNRNYMFLQASQLAKVLPEFQGNFRLRESGVAKSK